MKYTEPIVRTLGSARTLVAHDGNLGKAGTGGDSQCPTSNLNCSLAEVDD